MANICNMRISGELRKMATDKSDEMTLVQASESDLRKLIGSFQGFENTPYEGGVYKIDIIIPDGYPFKPPKAKFITPVWHPNISSATGYICLDLLKEGTWAAALSMKNVLTSIKTLLILAQPDDPQDAVVASQYTKNKELFEKTASYWNYVHAGGPAKPYFAEMDEKVQLVMKSGSSKSEAIHQLSMGDWKTV